MNIIEPIDCTAIDGWCVFNPPNGDGNTWCQVCKKPSPNNEFAELEQPIKPKEQPIERNEPIELFVLDYY